jgi:hypothetical protein
MTRLRRLYSEGKLSPDRAEDHAGRFVSSCVRRAREQAAETAGLDSPFAAQEQEVSFGAGPYGSTPYQGQAEQPTGVERAARPQARIEPVARPNSPAPPERWRQSWGIGNA